MKRFIGLLILLFFSIIYCFGQTNKDLEKKLAKAEAIFADYNNSEISVAALVINNDTVRFLRSYGANSSINKLYGLGKISKYFTAISILKLAEEGDLKLSDKLSNYFTDFSDFTDSVTIEQLLIYKSGLPFLPRNINYLNRNEIDGFLKGVFLNENFKDKTIFNDLNYYLLSRIVEKIYKKGYVKFIKREILKPINVKNVIIIDHNFNDFNDLPHGYVIRDSILQEIKPSYNKILPGVSGVFLSIDDLSKFIISLNKGEIISKETFKNLYSVAYLDDTDNNLRGMYGLNGIKQSVYGTNYFYEGGFSDFGTQSSLRVPIVNTNVILLTNQPGVFGIRKKAILLSNIFSGKFLYPGK